MELSEAIPHIGEIADDICLVRSMVSEHNNHTEGLVLLNTGKIFPGRPAFGSWISYALGTENQNLPAYIVLRDPELRRLCGTLLPFVPTPERSAMGNSHRSTDARRAAVRRLIPDTRRTYKPGRWSASDRRSRSNIAGWRIPFIARLTSR